MECAARRPALPCGLCGDRILNDTEDNLFMKLAFSGCTAFEVKNTAPERCKTTPLLETNILVCPSADVVYARIMGIIGILLWDQAIEAFLHAAVACDRINNIVNIQLS